MVFEMYVDDGITIEQFEGASGTLSGVTTKSNIDGTKTRSIIHFSYNGLASGFNDLDIDIKLKSKTDPQTTIYVVVYGVKGNVNNASVGLWDRLYYYDNYSIEYEVPIDMKGKKIKGVGDGTSNSDAVNYKQLIDYVNKINTYYYFTNQLKHNNATLVKFPSGINSHPFSLGFNQYRFRISLSGNYVIYTDFYKNDGDFKIWDRTNSIYLFTTKLANKTDWTPITFNTVIPVNVDNGFGHADIQLQIGVGESAIFNGIGYSTFYIKYMGP